MKHFSFFALLTLMGLAFFIVGCSKTGPAGPAGPAGPQGAQGATGAQGPQGDANVTVDTFSLTSSQWLYNSQYSMETSPGTYTEYFTRYHTVTLPALTKGIIDSGLVLVYFVPNPPVDTAQWAPLPYQFLDGSDAFFYDVAYETYVGSIEMEYYFQQINSSATLPSLASWKIATYKFKIVLMTASIVAQMKQQGVDVKNYGQVNHFLNLP